MCTFLQGEGRHAAILGSTQIFAAVPGASGITDDAFSLALSAAPLAPADPLHAAMLAPAVVCMNRRRFSRCDIVWASRRGRVRIHAQALHHGDGRTTLRQKIGEQDRPGHLMHRRHELSVILPSVFGYSNRIIPFLQISSRVDVRFVVGICQSRKLVDVSVTRWYYGVTRCVRRACALGNRPLEKEALCEANATRC